jgi:hypothetical protein
VEPFKHETDVVKFLQGAWQREDEKVSFNISNSYTVGNINGAGKLTETTFTIDFNPQINKWELSSFVFGKDSQVVQADENSFTIIVLPNTVFIPDIPNVTMNPFKVTFLRQ